MCFGTFGEKVSRMGKLAEVVRDIVIRYLRILYLKNLFSFLS